MTGINKWVTPNIVLIILMLVLGSSCVTAPRLTLVEQGKSKYTIVLSENASLSENHAAEELQETIQKISRCKINIVTISETVDDYRIFVGKNLLTDSLLIDVVDSEFGDEEFLIRTRGNDLFIIGGKKRGTMYGVYTFLEDFLDCRWYTREVIRLPAKKTITLSSINDRQKPAFEYRMPFYTESFDKVWATHNKINGYCADLPAEVGGKMRYVKGHLGHTFYALVPPQKYFQQHPEYFSLVKGKRVGDRGQICLTNPEVLNISIAVIERWLEEEPEADIISITQNDWEDWCECSSCLTLDEREGSHAASVVYFVNAIADSLGEKYPGKLFDTFAYTYTQKPPKLLTVRDNVLIRICHMQPSCDAHPLEECELNAEYVQNLRDWRKKGANMYAWHYVTNFSHYLMPFPNFNAIKKDIKFYYKEGVSGIFCQGDSQEGGGGEWAELRSYVLAKLFWDPNCDVDAIIDEFMGVMYGSAAIPVREYFDMMHAAVLPVDQHFNLFSNVDEMGYLTSERIEKAHGLFNEAESLVAGDPAVLARVRKARLPVYYADLWFQGQNQIQNQTPINKSMLQAFEEIVAENGIIYQSERSDLSSFLQILSGDYRFVQNLKIIGPFDGPKANLLQTKCPPEYEFDFSKEYRGVAGTKVIWKNWKEDDGLYVDFTKVFNPDTIGIAYGLCFINSPVDFTTQLGIGSNDGVRVYFNDKLVHDRAILRKATPNSDLVEVTLKMGWNKVLVKIDQIGGGWGMFLTVKDPEKMLRFTTDIHD